MTKVELDSAFKFIFGMSLLLLIRTCYEADEVLVDEVDNKVRYTTASSHLFPVLANHRIYGMPAIEIAKPILYYIGDTIFLFHGLKTKDLDIRSLNLGVISDVLLEITVYSSYGSAFDARLVKAAKDYYDSAGECFSVDFLNKKADENLIKHHYVDHPFPTKYPSIFLNPKVKEFLDAKRSPAVKTVLGLPETCAMQNQTNNSPSRGRLI